MDLSPRLLGAQRTTGCLQWLPGLVVVVGDQTCFLGGKSEEFSFFRTGNHQKTIYHDKTYITMYFWHFAIETFKNLISKIWTMIFLSFPSISDYSTYPTHNEYLLQIEAQTKMQRKNAVKTWKSVIWKREIVIQPMIDFPTNFFGQRTSRSGRSILAAGIWV